MLNPAELPVPTSLRRPRYLITRQTLIHNDIDYQAVMASRAQLRAWSHSEWPEDDFTLAQNLEDLAGHIEDHEADVGYGFSLLEPGEQRLLGSLYLEPVAPFAGEYLVDSASLARLDEFDVRVEYWLRAGTPEDLERDLLATLESWLEEAWWFRRPVFAARKGMAARRALYRSAGLGEVANMVSADGAREWRFYARQAAG